MPTTARGGVDHIAPQEIAASSRVFHVPLDVFQTHRLVGDEAVKLLHHQGFREHRQLVQGGISEPAMKLLVEGRVSVRVPAQAVDHALLMLCQQLAVPVFL